MMAVYEQLVSRSIGAVASRSVVSRRANKACLRQSRGRGFISMSWDLNAVETRDLSRSGLSTLPLGRPCNCTLSRDLSRSRPSTPQSLLNTA